MENEKNLKFKIDFYELFNVPVFVDHIELKQRLEILRKKLDLKKEEFLRNLSTNDKNNDLLINQIEEQYNQEINKLIVAYHILSDPIERIKYDSYYDEILENNTINKINDNLKKLEYIFEKNNISEKMMSELSINLDDFIHKSEVLEAYEIDYVDSFFHFKNEVLKNQLISNYIMEIKGYLHNLFIYKEYKDEDLSEEEITNYVKEIKNNCLKPYIKKYRKPVITKEQKSILNKSFTTIKSNLNIIEFLAPTHNIKNKLLEQVNSMISFIIPRLDTINLIENIYKDIIIYDINYSYNFNKFAKYKIQDTVENLNKELITLYQKLLDLNLPSYKAIAVIKYNYNDNFNDFFNSVIEYNDNITNEKIK